jgi:hypothetical protein
MKTFEEYVNEKPSNPDILRVEESLDQLGRGPQTPEAALEGVRLLRYLADFMEKSVEEYREETAE